MAPRLHRQAAATQGRRRRAIAQLPPWSHLGSNGVAVVVTFWPGAPGARDPLEQLLEVIGVAGVDPPEEAPRGGRGALRGKLAFQLFELVDELAEQCASHVAFVAQLVQKNLDPTGAMQGAHGRKPSTTRTQLFEARASARRRHGERGGDVPPRPRADAGEFSSAGSPQLEPARRFG